MLLGHIGQGPVILARSGGEVFAIGATCTHYGGPLAEGLLVGHTVRCPWHHACFSMRTGEAVRAPALNPVACWSVETIDGRHFVRGRHELPSRQYRAVQRLRCPVPHACGVDSDSRDQRTGLDAALLVDRHGGTLRRHCMGDALASRRAVGLGVPIASVCTAVLTMAAFAALEAVTTRSRLLVEHHDGVPDNRSYDKWGRRQFQTRKPHYRDSLKLLLPFISAEDPPRALLESS
jgi:nitrite reductase/ring-hydroxylating ferredoxin subunit